jgi:hypothetical protein
LDGGWEDYCYDLKKMGKYTKIHYTIIREMNGRDGVDDDEGQTKVVLDGIELGRGKKK